MPNEERRLWIFALILVAIFFFCSGSLFTYEKTLEKERSLKSQPNVVATSRLPVKQNQHASTTLSSSEVSPFTAGMGRLNDALLQHSSYSEEQLFEKANAAITPGSIRPCPFEWKNGEAALVLQRNESGQVALAGTVKKCTEAIERLP